jgi:hypothetical protein
MIDTSKGAFLSSENPVMNKLHRKLLSFSVFLLAFSSGLSAQTLLLDRGLHPSGLLPKPDLHAAWVADKNSVVGDDFTVGNKGEIWFIDTVRVWAIVDTGPGPLFDKITLFGGLAGQPLPKEQLECACHGLVPLKTAGSSGSADVNVSPAPHFDGALIQEEGKAFRVLQLEFRNVRWSVPGGLPVQFAVKPETTRAWYNYASEMKTPHRLRIFDAAGQLRAFRGGDENGINLQVWGHQSANISIHKTGSLIQVLLSGASGFDVNQVDVTSLRLGNGRSGPVSSKVQNTEGAGAQDLLLMFRAADLGLIQGSSVCLAGKRLSGLAFEGCDLLTHGKP